MMEEGLGELELRLARAEKRLRIAGGVAVVALLAGAAGISVGAVAAGPKRGPVTVRAPFRVLDAAGKVCLEMGSAEGTPFLSLGGSFLAQQREFHREFERAGVAAAQKKETVPVLLLGGDGPSLSLGTGGSDNALSLASAADGAHAYFSCARGIAEITAAKGVEFNLTGPGGGFAHFNTGGLLGMTNDAQGVPDRTWRLP